jgi:hypothetical protein
VFSGVAERRPSGGNTLKRSLLHYGAIVGAVTVSALAVSPAFAAATVSQATAQSIDLSIGGQSAISQKVTATNDGTTEARNNASTIPTLADLLTGNNALGVGVAPQDAQANADGTSYACAGLAGTGGGIAYVGHSSCDVDTGQPLTLNLGKLDLDLVHLFGDQGAITSALTSLNQVGGPLDGIFDQLVAGLAGTPLGSIALEGALSAVESDCTANPNAAQGGAEILDTSGDRRLPIRATIPTGAPTGQPQTQTLNLVDFDLNLEPRPGGYDLLVDLDTVFNALVAAIEGELDTAVQGQLQTLNPLLVDPVLSTIRDQIVNALVDGLRDPLLQQLSDNVLKVTLLDRTFGDGGKSVDVKALRAQVLPAAAQFAGAALIDGTIGHVTCGPDQAPGADVGGTQTCPKLPCGNLPDIPTVVDSGLPGHADHTTRNVLGATAALLLLAGTAGLAGYRRLLNK